MTKTTKTTSKKNKKEEAYVPTVLPVCCFFSMMTAIVIAIALAITFSSIAKNYELINSSRYNGSFESAIASNQLDSNMLTIIDSDAVLDLLYNTKSSGFLYVSSTNCGDFCTSYAEKLGQLLAEDQNLDIYHYHATSVNSKDQEDALATKLTLDGASAPALLYVKDGYIYDRVDNTNEASTESFIEKYK